MTRERIVAAEDGGEDEHFQSGLRPQSLDEYVGQRSTVERLKIAIQAAKARGESLDHLLFHGPPGLGKCIAADSLIATENGLIEFRELLPPDMKAGESRAIDLHVFGINGLEAASHVYCSGLTATRRLRTRAGFEIEGTPQHPLLVATPQGPRWKTLAELQRGDYVAVARGTQVWGTAQSATWRRESNLDRRLDTETLVSALHESLTQALHRAPSAAELHRVYCAAASAQITPTPSRTALRLGLPLSDGRKTSITARASTRGLAPLALPSREGRALQLDADLGYLLGAIIGDAHVEPSGIIALTCDEREMQGEIRRICARHFGFAPTVHRYAGKAARLNFALNQGRALLELGLTATNARQKTVPRAVLGGTREVAVGFLQGLFDADAHARTDGVEYSTRSRKLSQQVQLLLLNLGIVANRTQKTVRGEPHFTVFIGGAQALDFHDEIGFRLSRKRAAKPAPPQREGAPRADRVPCANALLCALLSQTAPHPRTVHRAFDHAKRDDRVPGRAHLEKLLALLPAKARTLREYSQLQQLCDARFFWDRVENLESSATETYDFVVPQTHSFVANGLFNHNTTLGYIIAQEMGRDINLTSGPALERPADMMPYLVNAQDGDIIFIDEIHRVPRVVEEFLYSAMEDYVVNFTLDKGLYSKPLPFQLKRFTLIGATTRPAMLSRPMRDRFGIQQHLDFYDEDDLVTIARRSADILNTRMEESGAREMARRARGTPRIVNRLLHRVRDYAQVRADGVITKQVADEALQLEGIDALGLDRLDELMLRVIKDTYGGGPVGSAALAATMNEELDTLEDVVEPYLLKIGFLARTPQGRRITRRAYEHLGEPPPPDAITPTQSLFDEAADKERKLRDEQRRKRD